MFKKSCILLILIMMFGTSLVAQNAPDQNTIISNGAQVPTFRYEYEKGKSSKSSELKGKIILINFFATWCAPCRMELPKIQSEIWEKHHDNSKFIMLTFGREHNWQEVIKFKDEQKISFPLYPDPKRDVYGLFAKQTIPRSFLIDEQGKVIFTTTGFDEGHFNELIKLIDSKL